jgi:uncharacterized membrane protein SirB2
VIEHYLAIKHVHVAAVILSGALFFARGLAVQLGAARHAMAAPLRYASYAIDTVLLTAALMLTTVLRQYPLQQPWLTAKVALLVAYIVLGSFALKRGRTRRVRLVAWLAALGVYLTIVSIARAHDPWGWLRWL